MIGKTISLLEKVEYGDFILHFTDGTALKVESYGEGGVDLHEIDAEQRRREAAERQGKREAERVAKLIRFARDIATARERLEAAELFDLTTEHGRAGFLAWEDWRHYVTPWHRAFADEIRAELDNQRSALMRMIYGTQTLHEINPQAGQFWTVGIHAKPDCRTELEKRVDAILNPDRKILEAL